MSQCTEHARLSECACYALSWAACLPHKQHSFYQDQAMDRITLILLCQWIYFQGNSWMFSWWQSSWYRNNTAVIIILSSGSPWLADTSPLIMAQNLIKSGATSGNFSHYDTEMMGSLALGHQSSLSNPFVQSSSPCVSDRTFKQRVLHVAKFNWKFESSGDRGPILEIKIQDKLDIDHPGQ